MRNTIRTAFGAALALAAAALCSLPTAPSAIAEASSGESSGVRKVRLGSLRRDDLVVVDVAGVPGGGGAGGVDTNAVRDIVREEFGGLGPADIGALPDDYVPPVTSVNGRTGDVVVAVSDIAGAVTTNDVESIVGRHYETNTSVRIGAVEGRVSATERWQYADGVTRSAVESGFTGWAVEFEDPPEGSSPPYDAVVAQVMASGNPTGLWSIFSPTDTVHSADTALLGLVLAPDDATNLVWAVSAWGPVAATRVRVPTTRELDAKAEAKDLQAATASLSNDVSRIDGALAGMKADLAAVAEAKADRDIVEYELDPPRMDTNDVWVVSLDGTVLRFCEEDEEGFRIWAGTNSNNFTWVYENQELRSVTPAAVQYTMREYTLREDGVESRIVSNFSVYDVVTQRPCGLPTVQSGLTVTYPPESVPKEGEDFAEQDLRYEYDASAVPAYSKVLLSYKDAGNNNDITNVASIGRGRRRRIETSVVYGTGLEKAVAGLRDDLVSRKAVETGFTEWVVKSDRPLGEDVVPGLVEDYVGFGLWSLFPAGSTNRSTSAALTSTYVGGRAPVTNLSWKAGATIWGVAVRATRTRVPAMADLQTIENTVSTYLPWLEDYATNNYTAAKLANRRAKDLEAWRYTNSVSRADIERGITGWAVTPMWPLGRVEVRQVPSGADAGKWTLFRPGESTPMSNIVPRESTDNPVTNLVWTDVQVSVDARWTNGLAKAGIPWSDLAVDAASGKTNVTARFDVVARRTVIRAAGSAGSPGNYLAVSNAAMNALSRKEAETGFTEWIFSDGIKRKLIKEDIDDGRHDWLKPYRYEYSSGLYRAYSIDAEPTRLEFRYFEGTPAHPDEWGGYDFYATRVRLPTMADLNGKASTNDVVLTPVYSQTPTFSKWVVSPPSTGVFWTGDKWWFDGSGPADDPEASNPDATTVRNTRYNITATRVRTDVVGYTLGDQADKPLQPQVVKRYPLFVIDLNPGEGRVWQHIELKATTNNFKHATTPNMVFFTNSTCNQDDPSNYNLPFTYDWCRLYIMSKRTDGGAGDVRRWTRIKNTGELNGYAPLALLVIVDPHAEWFKRTSGFAEWLREDNAELTWSYTRIGTVDPEQDQDGNQCWRPIMPVRWYAELPSWANEEETVLDAAEVAAYVPPWAAELELTPVRSRTPAFSEWVCEPAEYEGTPFRVVEDLVEGQYWMLVWHGSHYAQGYSDSTSLTWDGLVNLPSVTATRTRTDIVGYTLGSQTDKVLVSTNALSGQTFDFATMAGMYRAVRALTEALGGTVTNFPSFRSN